MPRRLLARTLFRAASLAAADPVDDAVRAGDTAALRLLLDGRGDVDAATADGASALAWAAYRDDGEAVAVLLGAGADVDAANDYGITALDLACGNGNAAIVADLLAAGADPNLARLTGETPLMYCARHGAASAVHRLLEAGADPNAREQAGGQTALMWAAAGGHAAVVAALLEHGARVDARSRVVAEPEPYVVETPGLTVFGMNFPPSVRFREQRGGFTALDFAARGGSIGCADLLLAAGADVNGSLPELGSPLHLAIAGGHEALARRLLDAGADPNATDAWGVTPLHLALHEGLLILNNFRPSRTDRFGWTRHNMPRLVAALLEHGADPDAAIRHSYPHMDDAFLARSMEDPPQVDPVGATPLLLAAASGDLESMRLLATVADKGAKTVGGATVLMLAAGAGAERRARKEKTALEAVRFAPAIGAGDVDARLPARAAAGRPRGRADGRTALHFAVQHGWSEVARLLIEHGADVEAEDRYGMTPLKIALGDPEGRYYRQVGDGNYDGRFRKLDPTVDGDPALAALLVSLGAKPYTGTIRDRSGE
ncbi:MAG: ankyrin repeat domain-containing protein [Woeseiaceae bacterium]|nr:ankyrin repeat domain-containing protein [Woeseiaceae bacterium]